MTDNPRDSTHFGFQRVVIGEKARRVAHVFSSVASRYDVMNDLMSFGVHRLWKAFTLTQTGLKPGQSALDVAGGTGDLTRGLAHQVGPDGLIVLADINAVMIETGRRQLVDAGLGGAVAYVQADAEKLPFGGKLFNCVTLGFGLRNMTRKEAALSSIYHTLKPGGRLLILEFSQLTIPALRPLYDFYSFSVLPQIGKIVAKDEASYRYLAESIRIHPNQETLKQMMEAAGFERCSYFNLSGGIAALHRGYRL